MKKIAERRLEAKQQLEAQLKTGTKPWYGNMPKEWHKANRDKYTIHINGKKHVPLTAKDIAKIKKQIANIDAKILITQ